MITKFSRTFFSFLFAAAIIFESCRKDGGPQNNSSSDDECAEGRTNGSGEAIAGRYIVLYKTSSVSARGMTAERLNDIGAKVLQRNSITSKALEESFGGLSGGFIATISSDEAARLSKDESIANIEPDRIISLGTCFTVVAPSLITWNINRVGFGDGRGKRAWIIDTGIDFDHPDLNVDTSLSKSFINRVRSAQDENGHGTHVAGIIGAKNNQFGVLGVASGATVISLRVLDKDGEGLLSNIVKALAYINNNASPGDVVNMSVGDDEGGSTTLDQQVRNTASQGIFIAIAAGNEKEEANKYSPGRTNAENIYTVSAVDSLDRFASFSNYGNDVVDYSAPGVKILSTFLNGRYAYMSGTSMAAPHVAGLLLLKGRNITSSGTALNDPDGTADPIAHY
jgi:hypothetical protein